MATQKARRSTSEAAKAAARDYDIVIYGASGFVGKLATEYLAHHVAPGSLHWAIAGRNAEKLQAVKSAAGADVDVLVADSSDEAAVDAVAASTRVVLNTAGPFALYGTPVVDACVRAKTHYVDITGETRWIKTLIERYHEQAASDGTRIIPCCGFDSVPSDLGTYLLVHHMQREWNVACKQVKAYFRMYGGFNGGTMASNFHAHESDTGQAADPFLLDPADTPHTATQIARNRDVDHALYDVDVGTWVGPYFMAPINTRVVRRSAALHSAWHEPYGPDFAYQEYLKYEAPFAQLKAGAVTTGLSLFERAMRRAGGRDLLKRFLPKPGEGPSQRVLDSGWFVCELLGLAQDGRRARVTMRHQGDPSNRATVRFVCESALALALEFESLPGGLKRGGLLTPATALGEVLAERLRKSGMAIDISA